MSGKSARAARQTGNNKAGQNSRAAKNTKNAKSAKNAQNAKNARGAKSAKSRKDATIKETVEKKDLNKVLWISVVVCVVAVLVVALVLILNDGKGGNKKGDDTTTTFFPSNRIDENGFWEGFKASDHVTLFNYKALSIPKKVHEIANGDVYAKIYEMMEDIEEYTIKSKEVTDRAVADGDMVNIDFVGSVDGVEFENGSTGGAGTPVIAGSTQYVDGFLTQIIGHMPGETFEVRVTFPEDYNQAELRGKAAVFVTTVNYITEYEINDAFVATYLSGEYGWLTVNQMKVGIREQLKKEAIKDYVDEYLANEAASFVIPEKFADYQEGIIAFHEEYMLSSYQEYADMYGLDLDSFLQMFVGVSGKDELIAQNREYVIRNLKMSFVLQAIAEDANISVSIADMEKYMPDYASYVEVYGLPWLMQYALGLKVIDYIVDNAKLA